MPHDPNVIQRGDLIQRLARALEIKGQRAPSLHLDEIVSPMVVIEDLTRQTEFLNPKDRSAALAFPVAAVAGELGFLAVVNPTGSETVAIVDEVLASVSVATVLNLGRVPEAVITGTGFNTGICQWLDRRNAGVPVLRGYSGSDPGDVSGDLYNITRVGSAGPAIIWGWGAQEPRGIVLEPGVALVACIQTAAVGMNITFRWREISEP